MSDSLLKSYFTDDGDLVIQVVGLPFGSPEHLDLQGDFADEQTDTGGLPLVFSYFDHRKSLEWLPEEINPFKEELIGYAKSVGKTKDGLIYDIIVDRHKRYKNLVKKLADDGFLKASTEVKFRENDPNVPGRLKTWHITAVDLTPTAANPDAEVKAVYEEMAKSISLPEDNKTMADEKKQPDQSQNGSGDGEAGETLAQKTAKRFEAINATEKSMDMMTPEEKQAKLDNMTPEEKAAVAANPDSSQAKGIDMEALAALIRKEVKDAVEPIAKQVEDINNRGEKTSKSVGEIIEAFDVLTENVEKTVKTAVAKGEEEGKKSNLEKRIEGKQKSNPNAEFGVVPASWPGAGN